MEKQIVQSNRTEWITLVEEGIKTEGLYVKVLRTDENTKRSPTILLKFEPGASYPNHNQPAGEEAFNLEDEILK